MNKKITKKLPGILITCLFFIAATLFTVMLIRTKIVPTKLLLIAIGVFLVLTVCVYFLTCNTKRTKTMIFGCVLVFLVLAVMMVGAYYLNSTITTLDKISNVNVEIAEVGIYVRNDDPAQSTADLTGYRFGIAETMDRANTDKTLAELENTLGTALQVTAYPGIPNLVDALLEEGSVDVLVFNSAYLDVLNELEGYGDKVKQLRLVHTEEVEVVVEATVEATKPANENTLIDLIVPEVEKKNNTFAMYISGIDSHGSLNALGRSDVNILAVINPDTRQVLLVSTPRDFYVPLPISDGYPDKLTHAGIYGVDVSMGTLEMLYGIDIDYFFRVNFSGFERIIDALGGVTVYSDYTFTALGKYYIQEGENYLNGAQALAFARDRYSFAEGDRQRGKNQMQVIKAVINKAVSPALLTNYTAIMDSVAGSFETSMPYDKIAELVRKQLDEGGSWNVVSCSANGYGDYQIPYSLGLYAYVMVPDQATVDAAKTKIEQVYNGEILS